MHDPGSAEEHESWCRGVIRETQPNKLAGRLVHVVTINGFKWDAWAPWGTYDGVPECLAVEAPGLSAGEVLFLDVRPPRRYPKHLGPLYLTG